jgi:hypothetical protein
MRRAAHEQILRRAAHHAHGADINVALKLPDQGREHSNLAKREPPE